MRGALVVLLLFGSLLTGCASLPHGVERLPSHAAVPLPHGALTRLAAASLEDQPGSSGFRLLPAGDQALEALLALAGQARATLDAQYYLVSHDASGLRFLRALRDAAEHGVRVRLLIDDLYAAGQDGLLAGLAATPNLEVRMFNPLPARRGGVITRVVLSAHEFSRVNRRMHNKLFIADNALAVTGGRNVGDAYFGRGQPANFIDLDVLAAGPVVAELSAVFDRYWNSEHAYPVQSLAASRQDGAAARQRFEAALQGLADLPPPAAIDALGQTAVGAQLRAGRLTLQKAPVRVLADRPGKVDAAANRAATDDGTVAGLTLDLVGAAEAEVLLASPYFVPGRRSLETLRGAVAKNVRVSVMTNSLATTDEPLVHFGYARYRNTLLEMGVALYELIPTTAHQRTESALGLSGSLGRLHAKFAVVDRRHLFIGSMNMDPRSARWNTELGLVIDSAALAEQARGLLQGDQLPGSYQLRLAAPGRIEWVARQGGAEVVHAREPASSALGQVRLWLRSQFVDEELL